MKNSPSIEKGDIVDCFFNGAEAIYYAEVLFLPCETAYDCWVLKSKNKVYYIKNYECIVKTLE